MKSANQITQSNSCVLEDVVCKINNLYIGWFINDGKVLLLDYDEVQNLIILDANSNLLINQQIRLYNVV